jgi:predicted nucleotidyltransferase
MAITDKISDEIKAIARAYISDAEVMLFGSRAKNNHSSDSDYDILIVTGQKISVEQKTPIRTSIRKDLLIEGIRSDILIQSKTEIEKKKRLPGHFIRNILKDAILL